MKKISLFMALMLAFVSMEGFAEEPVALEISEWRPYIYMEDNKPAGHAYEIVEAVFERADIAYDFQIKPWARVYSNGLKKRNYFIPGLGRTPKREDLFQWIAPLNKGVDVYFYKLKNNPVQINNLEEAKQHTIGVERGSYYHDFLEENFEEDKINHVSQPDQLLETLVNGRFNFILLEEARVLWVAEKLKIDPDLFEKSLFAFRVQDYLAASLNTDKELVRKLQKAYMELKEENLIDLR